jgi:hypothetical protein
MKKATFIVISAIVLFSCKKDKDEPQACTTNAANIAGAYKITSMLYKESASTPETEVLPLWFEDCERDDVLTFNANGSYQEADAGIECAPPGGGNGTWALSGNNMTINGDPITLESFNCTTLVLINTDTQVAGDRIKITLRKQQ